jgi:hypothetical protein
MAKMLPSDLEIPARPVTDVHLPGPDWLCRAPGCAAEWPCPPAREALIEQARASRFLVRSYLDAQLVYACHDLPDVPAGVLWDRFVGFVP